MTKLALKQKREGHPFTEEPRIFASALPEFLLAIGFSPELPRNGLGIADATATTAAIVAALSQRILEGGDRPARAH